MTQGKLPVHRIYTCRNCKDSWLEENETPKSASKNRRCMSCGSSAISKSSELSLTLAHALLKHGLLYSTKNVAKLMEDTSAKKWEQKNITDRIFFSEQIELLNNIYVAMRTSDY